MRAVVVEKVVDEALKTNLLIEVDYVNKRGVHTRRVMEPLSIVHDYANRRHIFWGRCLEHNRTEPRLMGQIEHVRIVDVHTDERKHSRVRKTHRR